VQNRCTGSTMRIGSGGTGVVAKSWARGILGRGSSHVNRKHGTALWGSQQCKAWKDKRGRFPVSRVSFNPGCFSRCPKDVNVDPAEVAKMGRYWDKSSS